MKRSSERPVAVLLCKVIKTIFVASFFSCWSSAFRASIRCSSRHPTLRLKSLISNLNNGFKESDSSEDNYLQKWERMYEQGAVASESPFKLDDELDTKATSQVRVVSFDLDNTLWKTSATIDAANDALAQFLTIQNITQPRRVEKIMGDLFRENKSRYCPIDTETAKGPTNLTLLRKDALKSVLVNQNDFSEDDAEAMAQQAFNAWVDARYEAILVNTVDGAIECLQAINSLKTAQGQKVLVGAITDGNSNPMDIPLLSEYFSFVVNAEHVGVSKPDSRVYLEAVRQLAQQEELLDLFKGCTSDDLIAQAVGPWWVHIGDDFVKDVVAAKDVGMRTIWSRELVADKLIKAEQGQDADTDNPKPKRSVEEFVKEISSQTIVKMEVGAADYLVNSVHREFADAVVDNFLCVSNVIQSWHEEGVESIVRYRDSEVPTPSTLKESFAEELAPQEPPISQEAHVIQEEGAETAAPLSERNKFCIACGTKLPVTARFCSSCGEKQQ